MSIRVLSADDAHHYQVLRLKALKTDPEAFASTYEREVQFSNETIVERVTSSTNKFVLGYFHNGALIGNVTFLREGISKAAHKGNVFGMYVEPEFRSKVIGKKLLLALIKEAKTMEGLEQINLTVGHNNKSAKKLYQSVGFELYGTERHSLKINGQYIDEDLMVLFLDKK